MKKIFTDPSVVPCDMLRGYLEAEDIQVTIKNEHGSATAGAGNPIPGMPSLAFAWPEVWVSDNDFEAAKVIVAKMKKTECETSCPWICNHCQEEVDGELAVCWKCETPRKGNEKSAIIRETDGDNKTPPSEQSIRRKGMKQSLKSPLVIILLLINILLGYLYFSPRWKQPEDYDVYDSNGIRLGRTEWHENKMFPYKWVSYSTDGEIKSISFDSKDHGRPSKIEIPHESCREILSDNDTDGVCEHILVKFDSGAILELQDTDENGFFEKSVITLTNGEVYYIKHSNRTGLQLEVRNSSRKLLNTVEIMRLDEQL